ncbi:lipid carrier--UDP-N-acetylgalactosaminyltransferase [Chitinophaga alhagiae]|uniref:Lipid carrier--UDP-N-acetylgalactosaminyltransferase n=1 Tax=Chitinophaga alhagiae TaxID=2203219 RepID=A0ABN5LPK7_9BACT|nr:sugar transferase [Chitinophaga alhagiae]AWO01187.1 lipid carrier--UDP-N-acetylgalactosaminyltransferase [Chitinophaga alhagiae]
MYSITKRIFDLAFASLLLLLLLPFMLPICIILLFTDEREVFYRQERIGYCNRKFGIWKFATMLKNSPNMPGGEITLRNDPRVTRIGRFLRFSKINELPQLLNILSGEMSFVGPRPLMKKSFDQYSPEVQEKVYQSVPGITGIGSIIFRDEEELVTNSNMPPQEFYRLFVFPYKGELELWYHRRRSLYVDFMILILTVVVILAPRTHLPYKVFTDLPKRK